MNLFGKKKKPADYETRADVTDNMQSEKEPPKRTAGDNDSEKKVAMTPNASEATKSVEPKETPKTDTTKKEPEDRDKNAEKRNSRSKEKERKKTLPNKKPKFNFVDLLLFLLLVIVIVITVSAYSPWSIRETVSTSITTEKLTYTIELINVDQTLIQSGYSNELKIAKGDTVIDSDTGRVIGRIKGVGLNNENNADALIPTRTEVYLGQNKNNVGSVTNPADTTSANAVDQYPFLEMIDVPNSVSVYIVIEADAVYTEGKSFSVNGCRIAVNKQMNILLPNYSGVGICRVLDKPN